ncbi:hypothetical protein DV735_g3580, partial [Chaetothyriales sp. CBS 134920]
MATIITTTATAVISTLIPSSSPSPSDPNTAPNTDPDPAPSPFAYLVSFLLVGLCWGFTTPFIRRAALTYTAPTATSHPHLFSSSSSLVYRTVAKAVYTVLSILRKPAYAIPLVCNLTGSVWFFILVGKAELSLTVPITNSLAFLFTVLGEYVAEKKLISRDTWVGMACVCAGIAICVWSKM